MISPPKASIDASIYLFGRWLVTQGRFVAFACLVCLELACSADVEELSSGPGRSGSPGLRPIERQTFLELQDANGEVRFWVDQWGRVHAPEVLVQQQDYTKWSANRFAGIFGPAPVPGLQLVSRQPPGRRGIDTTRGLFLIPESIEPNGVVNRDTLMIPFYYLGARLIAYAYQLGKDCRRAKELFGDEAVSGKCERFRLDLRTSKVRVNLAEDPFFLEVRFLELQKARVELQHFQSVLAGIETVTANGKSYDLEGDIRKQKARTADCWRKWGERRRFCRIRADDFNYPPDWLTAHVDSRQLTPALIQVLRAVEWRINLHLDAAAQEAELTQLQFGDRLEKERR